MTSRAKSLLLLGTSHVGKSTCASKIGKVTSWPVISTDKLGRHPGRPWTGVPDAVLEFYKTLSDDTIHWFLKVHHENMRTLIGQNIKTAREMGEGFVLEGSALRPEYLADWRIGNALAVCLHVDSDVLRERILIGSGYSQQSDSIKCAIEKFVERSIRENMDLAESALKHNIQVIDVTDFDEADRLTKELVSRLDTYI